MKKMIFTILGIVILASSCNKVFDSFTYYHLNKQVTEVQPMTGIVFFNNNFSCQTHPDAISMEFTYISFNDIVVDSATYDWTVVEEALEKAASRGHQLIIRFAYTKPGEETTVPDYIKQRPDYNEVTGTSEGLTTHFPDWTNRELMRWTLEFHTKFAQKYNNDPRLAFIEVGFGLWGEYHIYDGPFELGVTFPSKEFQKQWFYHLDSVYTNLKWLVGINTMDDTYSPLPNDPSIKEHVHYGLFDDSFMQKYHYLWNEPLWNMHGLERYTFAPNGGEFSYYSLYDQEHVLDTGGIYGHTWEEQASKFHMTFILGNDQPRYQTFERIKQAGMAAGYHFKVLEFKADKDQTVVVATNTGTAPIYYDAYFALNGIRNSVSLKHLLPGDTAMYIFNTGYQKNEQTPSLTIECDHLIPGQSIQYDADF